MSKTTNKYSPEVRERAVRLVLDNQGQHESRWSAILSISSKIGARVLETASRIRMALSSACPEAEFFRTVAMALQPAAR